VNKSALLVTNSYATTDEFQAEFQALAMGASGTSGDGDDPPNFEKPVRGSGNKKPVQAGTLIACKQRSGNGACWQKGLEVAC